MDNWQWFGLLINFTLTGKFSHCGVDSFQLVFINGQWKIQCLIDTRRKQPCK